MTKRTFSILLFFSMFSCRSFFKKEEPFRLVIVSQRNLEKFVEANGSVEALTTIDIFSPVPGRLEKLYVKEGDIVKAKQKLGLVSSDSRSLFLDMASTKSKDEQEYWKNQLQLTPLISPTSGKIISVRTDLDEKITGAIAQITKGEVIRANVDEADLPSIKLGQPVMIRFDISPDTKILGTLDKVAETSKMVNNLNVYQVEVSLPPKEKLKSVPFEVKFGMSVTLNFPVGEKKKSLALPAENVDGQSMTTLTLIRGDNKKIKVKLGDLYGDWVEVIAGLGPGDKIKVPKFKSIQQKSRKSPLMIKKD